MRRGGCARLPAGGCMALRCGSAAAADEQMRAWSSAGVHHARAAFAVWTRSCLFSGSPGPRRSVAPPSSRSQASCGVGEPASAADRPHKRDGGARLLPCRPQRQADHAAVPERACSAVHAAQQRQQPRGGGPQQQQRRGARGGSRRDRGEAADTSPDLCGCARLDLHTGAACSLHRVHARQSIWSNASHVCMTGTKSCLFRVRISDLPPCRCSSRGPSAPPARCCPSWSCTRCGQLGSAPLQSSAPLSNVRLQSDLAW